MGTRGRMLLSAMVATWIATIVAIGLTAPPWVEGSAPRGYDLHMYAAAAVLFAGLAAMPLVSWLVDRRERGPRRSFGGCSCSRVPWRRLRSARPAWTLPSTRRT